MLIIDTLGRALGGADENAAGAMTKWLNGLDAIKRQFQCGTLLVHHGSEKPRGSTALPAAVDTIIRVKRAGSRATLVVEKNRHGPKIAPITLEARPVILPGGGSSLALVPLAVAGAPASKEPQLPTAKASKAKAATRAEATAQTMLATLTDAQTAPDWQKGSGVPRATFYRHLPQLVSAGKVVEVEGRFQRAA